MSILRAMNTGVSGLAATAKAISVVGDNIANVNTVGFKQQRALFQDILGRAPGKGDEGMGVRVGSVEQLFSQGSLSSTGVSTDLALDGDGFFVVQGAVSGVNGTFFTRAGQMRLDKDGFFTNAQGLKVQGYAALTTGGFSPKVADLKAATSALPPVKTTKISLAANVDSGATTPVAAWDAQNPGNTSNFSTSISVYDSLGKEHKLGVYFRKTGGNAWDYKVLADGGEITAGTPGQNSEIGSGSLVFNATGGLQTFTPTVPVSANFIGAAAAQVITVNLGTAVTAVPPGSGLDGVTQYASPSSVANQSQDGYASGSLTGVSVDGQGVVSGVFTNGQRLSIGQVAVAKFRSNQAIGRAGQNLWVETQDSGQPAIGAAGSGGRGAINAGSLEQSNVELAQQFVDMIQFQRSFQANSKTITTADELLQELTNLKR